MMKKLLFTAFIFLILMFSLSVSAFAANETSGDCGEKGSDVKWAFDKASGALTISGSGTMKNWAKLAPSGENAAPWRAYADSITSATVEGNISLGSYTFATLKKLKTVTLGNGVKALPAGAFYECEALEAVNIPDGLTEIAETAFYGCKSLSSLAFPSSVAKIASDALYGCGGLKTITVDGANNLFRSESNCLIERSTDTLLRGTNDGIIPESVKALAGGAFSGCSALKSITVPNTINVIGYGAFADCASLESMTLPFVGDRRVMADGSVDGMTEAEAGERDKINGRLAYIFGDSAIPTTLKSIVITDCETLEIEAFINCKSLTSLKLPEKLAHIKDGALFGCVGLEAVELPESLLSIGKAAFASCTSIKSISVPNKVVSIGETAFFGCAALTELTLGDAVESLGEGILYSCSALEALKVSAQNVKFYSQDNCIIEKASKKLIAGCKNSILPTDILVIGVGAFRNCNGLKDIALPQGLTEIEAYAFENCVSLTRIELPQSLKAVGDYAFAECSGIVTVKAPEGISYGESVFKNCISMQSEDMPTFENTIDPLGCAGCSGCSGCEGCAGVSMQIVMLIAAMAALSVALTVKKYK